MQDTVYLVWPNDSERCSSLLFPLGIGYIASYLVSKGIKVKILDHTFGDEYELSKEPAIYGIEITTNIKDLATEKIAEIKATNRENIVVVGGPHATCLRDELVQDKNIDYVISGEGEIPFYNLVMGLLRDGQPVFTKPTYPELDTLPFPDYSMFPVEKYMKSRPLKEFNMITSRGCPGNCVFCQPQLRNTFGPIIRHRSAKNVVDEIIDIKSKYKPHSIYFCDDLIGHDQIKELCDELITRKVYMQWRCQARVGIGKDMLKLMKKAGCYNIAFGVESGSQKILNKIQKGTTIKQIEDQFSDMFDVGVLSHAYFMVGNPGETDEDVDMTVALARRIRPFSMYVSIATAYPGTKLYEILKEEGGLPKELDYTKVHHFINDAFDFKMSSIDVVKAKKKVLSSHSSKRYKLKYIARYVCDWSGLSNTLRFIMYQGIGIIPILLMSLNIIGSGSAGVATNPSVEFFKKK